jgi:Zn-dependent peptidase ImmA (M78 family)
MSITAKCGTLAHELAHEYLHWQQNRRNSIPREIRELEAEATSYALLSHFGIEQHSERYLASWDANAETITSALRMVRDAVHHILTAMESKQDEAAADEDEQIAA